MAGAETISFVFTGNASGALGAIGAVSAGLHSIEGAGSKAVGALTSIATAAAKVALAVGAITFTAVAAGMTGAISAAAGFEKSISGIGAVSNLTAEQMKAVSAVALQIGKDTKFGAAEAATGIEELMKAGVGITDVLGGAARSAADLAAATGTDFKTAAEISANAMNVFNLKGADMARVANTITGAVNASAMDINDYKFALAASGAVAASLGINIEDLSTSFAVLSQAGLKGSDMGTSLKTMLMNLQPATKAQKTEFERLGITTADGANAFFDAAGNAKSMADIAGVLQTATAGMTKQQKLASLEIMFGSDAIRAATIFTEAGAEGFHELGTQMAGMDAGEVGKKRLDNLAGSMEQLKGTLETIQITIGMRFTPVLKRLVDVINQGLGNAMPQIEKWADQAAAGLDKLIVRATTAAPRFLALGAGLLAFGRQGLALAQGAIPKLVEGFERIKGFLSGVSLGGVAGGASSLIGGLVGAFKTIAPIAETVGRSIVANITDTFAFLVTRVIPPLVSIIQQTGQALDRTLLPAAVATGAVLRGIFGDTLDWLAKTVWPPFLSIVEQTSRFFTGVILPTLPAVAAALRTTLGEAVQWLATTVWPALGAAATVAWQFISGTIIPALPGFAAQVRDVLGKAIEWVGTTGWPMFLAGATIAWGFLTTKVIPAIRDVISWLTEKVPPAVAAVTTAWEALRSRVQPIIEALFNTDIKTAISKAGDAFSEFGTLALGWLTEQVAQIKWDEIWAASVDIAGKLGAYVMTLVVDFATWLSAQVALIPWETVWSASVEVATKLATYLSGLVVDFATWLGVQAASVEWSTVWGQSVEVGTKLATYLRGLVVDFGTWLGTQVAAIKWETVWVSATDIAAKLEAFLKPITVDFTAWLGQEVGKIKWEDVWAQSQLTASMLIEAVWAKVVGLEKELTTKINETVAAMDWHGIGEEFGQALAGAITGGVGSVETHLDAGALAAALGAFLLGTFKGIFGTSLQQAWAEAWKDFWTGPGPGATFVEGQMPAWFSPPGAKPGTTPPTPGGAGTRGAQAPSQMSMPSGPLSNEAPREAKIARAKAWAIEQGLQDPELFAAQLFQESSFDVGATSAAGARGIGQFIPGTGKAYAERLGVTYEEMVNSAELSIQASAMHMRDLQDQFGTQERALSAYFSGPGGGVWPSYVSAVRGRLPNVAGIPAEPRQNMSQQTAAPTVAGMVTIQSNTGGQLEVPRSSVGEGPGQYSADPSRGGYQIVGERAVSVAGQATKAPAGVNMAAFPIGSQFEMGLPWADAIAACGPAAVAIFMQATGRTPNAQEIMQISARNGWTRGAGMGGVEAFKKTLSDVGVDYATQETSFGAAAASSGAGKLTAISTAGHYFVSQGFNPETGAFNVGETGTALKGGKEWMTAAEITALAGPINGVLELVGQIPAAGEAATASLAPVPPAVAATGAAGQEAAPGIVATNDALTQTPIAAEGVVNGLAVVPPAVEATAAGVAVGAETIMAQFTLMSDSTLNSMTALGEGVLTTTSDMAGNTIATVTDMTGQVTNQSATLANGVSLNMNDMNVKSTSFVDTMAGTITTRMTDLSGNSVTTVTDMQGQVVSQFATMETEAGGKVAQLASTTSKEMGAVASAIQKPTGAIDSFKGAVSSMQPPQSAGFVREFGKIGAAASDAASKIKKAADAAKEFGGSGEKSGDIKGKNPLGKAVGGPVSVGEAYLVGERGPELFIPGRNGVIVPHDAISTGGTRQRGNGADADRIVRALERLEQKLSRGGNQTVNYHGVTYEQAAREQDRRQHRRRILYGEQG